MRWLPTLLCLLLTACGGRRPSVEEVLATPPDPLAIEVQGLLETCAIPDLEQLFDLLGVFDALLDPEAQDPPLTFTGLRILDGCIDWTLDSDADGTDDVSGNFCFVDSAGVAFFPFNPINLGNGVAEVADLLATLPDGTQVIVAFGQGGLGTGALTVHFQQGQATSGSGSVAYDREGCSTSYRFSDVLVQNLLAPLPNARVTLTLATPTASATGTIAMNGTRNAVVSVTKDERVIVYTLDLETFVVRGFQDPLTP